MIVHHLEYILPMVIHHICHFISQCSGLTRWLTPILTFRFDTRVPRGALLQTARLIGGYEGLAHSLVKWIQTRAEKSVPDSLLVCDALSALDRRGYLKFLMRAVRCGSGLKLRHYSCNQERPRRACVIGLRLTWL